MKKKIAILSLLAIFAVANTLTAQTPASKTEKPKVETKAEKKDDKACCKDKKADKKECSKDQAEKKECCKIKKLTQKNAAKKLKKKLVAKIKKQR
jgi:biopolymer transport protein ExbD